MTALDPESVTWRYAGDVRFALVLGRAFLLQAMHPTIAAGLADHSTFRTDPWVRLQRSWGLVLQTIYAADRDRVGAAVRAAHRHIKGIDQHGRRYHAYEPEAYWWVLATGFDSMLTFATYFGRPMSSREAAAAFDETRELGRRFGLRDRDMPSTIGDFRRSYAATLTDRLRTNQTVTDFLTVLREPPCPPDLPPPLWSCVRPLAARTGWLATIGTLPEPARSLLEIAWTTRDQAGLHTIALGSRALGTIPERWRYLPVALEAFTRVQIQGEQAHDRQEGGRHGKRTNAARDRVSL